MKTFISICLVFGVLPTAVMTFGADATKTRSIEKERKRIEGTWRVVAVVDNGRTLDEEDVSSLTVVNGSDGTWSIRSDGKEINKGTSTFDPTKEPKTIDFTPSMGEDKGKLHLGIYELGKDSRMMCFAQLGQKRPTDFSAKTGSGQTLVKFERVKKEK